MVGVAQIFGEICLVLSPLYVERRHFLQQVEFSRVPCPTLAVGMSSICRPARFEEERASFPIESCCFNSPDSSPSQRKTCPRQAWDMAPKFPTHYRKLRCLAPPWARESRSRREKFHPLHGRGNRFPLIHSLMTRFTFSFISLTAASTHFCQSAANRIRILFLPMGVKDASAGRNQRPFRRETRLGSSRPSRLAP